MIRDICKDEAFLAQKSQPPPRTTFPWDRSAGTLWPHHKEECVGMAANMIGVNKRIIVFDNEGVYQVMYNPEIVRKSGPLRDGGGLPVSHRHPARQAVEVHQGAVAE